MTKESRLRNRSSRNQSLLSTNPQNAASGQAAAQAFAGLNHHNNKEIREYVSYVLTAVHFSDFQSILFAGCVRGLY